MTTHFMAEDRDLFQDMLRILEEGESLPKKLETIFNPQRRIAAIAMALEAYRAEA